MECNLCRLMVLFEVETNGMYLNVNYVMGMEQYGYRGMGLTCCLADDKTVVGILSCFTCRGSELVCFGA